jgi:hypothetical protein
MLHFQCQTTILSRDSFEDLCMRLVRRPCLVPSQILEPDKSGTLPVIRLSKSSPESSR